MIDRVIDFSVRNPFVVIALAVFVAGWGVYSLLNTPVDAIPDLSENQVLVFADWPGRSPVEVEDQVTYPLSVKLQGLAGIRAVRATSEFGFSMLSLIFEDNVDFYFARQRVLERLSIAGTFLPEGVTPYLAPDATALGQIYWYTLEGENQDVGRLRSIQDWYVRYQLYSVPGVAEVASVGGFPIEYQVDINPEKLRAYGVSLGELYSAVIRSNASVGGRVVQKGNSEYLVRSSGWITSLEDVEATVIKSVAGTPIHVGDVAVVQLGPAQRRSVLEKDGSEVVGGVVLMRHGENPLEVTERIKQKITQLQAGLPQGVRIVPFYDRTGLIHRAIDTVREALLQESLVASLVILLIMRHVRAAAIICLMLPLAVLVSFILMRWLGISSNIMSLAGIAISIGVLVDAAIVMVDQGAHTLNRRFGTRPVTGDTRELLLPALRTVGRPIFFSLAIMIISFAPAFALSGMEGKMFHPLAYTKTFALVGVSILAVTLVPALIPWLVRGRIRHEEESWIVRRVIGIYQPVLGFVMDHPWPVTWLVGAVYIVGAVPTGSAWIFSVALISAFSLNIWANWSEEPAARARWPWAAVAWFLLLSGLAVAALARGWRPGSLLEIASYNPWLLGGAAVLLAAGLSLILAGLCALMRLTAIGTSLGTLLVVGLIAQQTITPLGREYMPPLDEGSILDMPVTVPRASITQVSDDLKARNAVIRSFPEVGVVVGKTGRAETPTDPAPLDMVETVVNLKPREEWPKRSLPEKDALAQTRQVFAALVRAGRIDPQADDATREKILADAGMFAIDEFNQSMRSMALAEMRAFEETLAGSLAEHLAQEMIALLARQGRLRGTADDPAVARLAAGVAKADAHQLAVEPDLPVVSSALEQIAGGLKEQGLLDETGGDWMVDPRGPLRRLWDSLAEALGRSPADFPQAMLASLRARRSELWQDHLSQLNWRLFDRAAGLFTSLAVKHVGRQARSAGIWLKNPHVENDVPDEALSSEVLQAEQVFARDLMLWQTTKDDLLQELNSVVQMPGWANIWTQPIINRIDMLATGVNTQIGVRVFGDDHQKIASVSNEIAQVLKPLRGAADVAADQIVGEGYLEIDIDRRKAARYGLNVGDIQDVVETALGGRVITTTVEGRERFPLRIRYARAFRQDEQSVEDLLVSAAGTQSSADRPLQIPLSQVADVRITQGPSMIRSENGMLRSYVRLNVRGRDVVGFVEEAEQVVASKVKLPEGVYIEWTGQFEHQVRARRTLSLVVPAVIAVIFLVLYITYHDLADTLMVMLLAVPGAVFGGVLMQYLLGHNFSVAVWVGFIACFGLATEGGLVILVYLREAIEAAGGLEKMTLAEVRQAVLDGAIHRTRPKLMTELTTMIGLAPMLWATGTGAEIIQPMAAPVLGGILVSDEVIDLLLPVLFFRVRAARWRKIHGRQGDLDQNAVPSDSLAAA